MCVLRDESSLVQLLPLIPSTKMALHHALLLVFIQSTEQLYILSIYVVPCIRRNHATSHIYISRLVVTSPQQLIDKPSSVLS